jgi:hypothetical protein
VFPINFEDSELHYKIKVEIVIIDLDFFSIFQMLIFFNSHFKSLTGGFHDWIPNCFIMHNVDQPFACFKIN